MGYSYSYDGQLCWDYCGASDGHTRKYRCPFGYCQSVAACPKCRKEHAEDFGKKGHRKLGCEVNHLNFDAKEVERKQMMEEGKYVRCSALGVDNIEGYKDAVHVLFCGINGDYIGYYMEAEVYHAYGIGHDWNVTPEDYMKHGKLAVAPNEFYGKVTTKEVVLSRY